MRGRPLHSWPTWKLRLALLFPRWRSMWAEAFLELHHRDVVEPAVAATNHESGPWLVAPPPGMH
jgi:hypothetical protein